MPWLVVVGVCIRVLHCSFLAWDKILYLTRRFLIFELEQFCRLSILSMDLSSFILLLSLSLFYSTVYMQNSNYYWSGYSLISCVQYECELNCMKEHQKFDRLNIKK